jgi:hypothetical protein
MEPARYVELLSKLLVRARLGFVACRDYGVRVPIFGARENKRMEAQVMTPVAATVKESTFFHYDVDKPLFFSVLINYSNCEKRIFPAF